MGEDAEIEPRLRALMLASLEGDAAAYRRLLSELAGRLRRYYAFRLHGALAANAEDLVQETLMAIHSRRQTYDTTQGFLGWAYAIARYKLIDHLRRSKVRATVPLEDDAAVFARDEEPDVTARLDTETVLATVPDRQRELIRRVKLDGASIAEAAGAVGMTETAAKVSIHRGLKALAARFGGGDRRDDR
jgi:RNA polymerase sigma factor (sigma-70 family)